MSSCGLAEAPGVGVQGAVDDIGQVALEGAEAGFAGLVLVLATALEQGGRAGPEPCPPGPLHPQHYGGAAHGTGADLMASCHVLGDVADQMPLKARLLGLR